MVALCVFFLADTNQVELEGGPCPIPCLEKPSAFTALSLYATASRRIYCKMLILLNYRFLL